MPAPAGDRRTAGHPVRPALPVREDTAEDRIAAHQQAEGKADEILADPANGPTEAINGRLETLRGIALGFTNLGNYVTRSLLHAGGFRQAIQPHLR